jgi:hypothetical protein
MAAGRAALAAGDGSLGRTAARRFTAVRIGDRSPFNPLTGEGNREITDHARSQAARRGISELIVMTVALMPEQVVATGRAREVRQSRLVDASGERYLVRVVVEPTAHDIRVVTVY